VEATAAKEGRIKVFGPGLAVEGDASGRGGGVPAGGSGQNTGAPGAHRRNSDRRKVWQGFIWGGGQVCTRSSRPPGGARGAK
jgi:hypothetical protein